LIIPEKIGLVLEKILGFRRGLSTVDSHQIFFHYCRPTSPGLIAGYVWLYDFGSTDQPISAQCDGRPIKST